MNARQAVDHMFPLAERVGAYHQPRFSLPRVSAGGPPAPPAPPEKGDSSDGEYGKGDIHWEYKDEERGARGFWNKHEYEITFDPEGEASDFADFPKGVWVLKIDGQQEPDVVLYDPDGFDHFEDAVEYAEGHASLRAARSHTERDW